MNSGYSSRLPYDTETYNRLSESVGPGKYRLNTDHAYNESPCLQTLGPRGTNGASILYGHVVAPSQKLVGIESILTNRNVRRSGAKRGTLNPVDVTKFQLQHRSVCNNTLNPNNTRFTHPPTSYRGVPVNRFVNLLNDPQEHIFYNFEVNTTLEARDNWIPNVPVPINGDNFSTSVTGTTQTTRPCATYCVVGDSCNASMQ
jgi:hypothetical protein